MNRRIVYLAGCLLVLVVVVAGVALAAPAMIRAASGKAASATVRSYTARAVPNPRSQARTRAGATRTGQAAGSGDLLYWGGQVEHYSTAYVIFWGSSWSNGAGGVTTPGQIVESYFQNVGYSGYDDIVTQYSDANSLIGNYASLGGAWVDTNNPATDTACSGLRTLEDSAIQSEVAHAIAVNSWPTDSYNATYFVFTSDGTTIHNPQLGCAYADQQFGGYCAYHSYSTVSGNFAYVAMPFTYDADTQRSANCIEPGNPNPNGDIAGDNLVTYAAMEQMDTITDPVPGAGWADSTDLEIGAKCLGDFPAGATQLRNGTHFYLQAMYSNAMHACETFARTWYFAEGYTGSGFTEYLTLENPTSTTANVAVEYLIQGGSPVTHTATVPANARKTITVNSDLGTNQSISLDVTSDQPIVAERPEYFTYTGLSGYTIPGGTDVLGMNQLASQFYFGYLDTTAGHDTYLTVLNPDPSAMSVKVSYYPAAGGSPTVVNHTVSANSRGTIRVGREGLAAGTYGAVVSLSLPGMVERPMYLRDIGTGYTGATDVVGNVSGGQTTWNFAEGHTATNFDEVYFLFNPTGTTANATVTFYKTDGSTVPSAVQVPAGGLVTVSANTVLGNGVDNSATVTSDQPIIAERYMSFDYTGPVTGTSAADIQGATDVLGARYTGWTFQFAEGYAGSNFGEYLTLENPGNTTANVTVQYLIQGSGAITDTYSVNPHSRKTVFTNTVSGVSGQSFSMAITSDQQILAERPMYFNYNGSQTGGSDVIGFEPPDAA